MAASSWAGGDMDVINDKGAVLGSTTIGSDGGYSVQVTKGSNYFLRASKGNASLKAYVEKADSSKTVGVSSGSSAVVKVMQQKMNVTELGEPGADVSNVTAQTNVAAIVNAIVTDSALISQVAQIAQAIAADITQNANFAAVSSVATVGVLSSAGNGIVVNVVNNVTINNITVNVITTGKTPSAPAGVSATAGNGSATISWGAVTDASTYGIYWGTLSGQYGSFKRGQSGTSATITGLTNGTPYYFVVTARNAYGESADSAQAPATPQSPPATPAGVGVAAGNGQATVSWTAVTGAVSYNVYYGASAGVSVSSTAKSTGITGTTATITGLTNGTPYYFIVTAVNGIGESSASTAISATPNAVANVTVTPGYTALYAIGQTAQLTAAPKDGAGSAVGGALVTWSSSNTAVATVSSAGLVTAVAGGTATVTATSGGISGTAQVDVVIINMNIH